MPPSAQPVGVAVPEELPPGPQLMASMRSVGYSLQTAIADVIDNSISAGATQVDIEFGTVPHPFVAIADDGCGMTADDAREAMRLAGKSAATPREKNDLGRFGLGLKTASLSQARSLVVVSKAPESPMVAYQWDLDVISETGRWTLLAPSPDSLAWIEPIANLNNSPSGTVVLWERLDLLEAQWGKSPNDLDHAMAAAKKHLGLVFHRFIEGEDAPRVCISINGAAIPASDPFLSKHRATQSTGEDRITIRGQNVRVTGYTLPALNKLKKAEYEQVLAAGAPSESQGFYIYRGHRLVTWGTWFRLSPRSNLKRLTRVKVDVPNALDDMWSLDVKKSQAVPPPEVRDRLRRLATNLAAPSERVHTYRGRKAKRTEVDHVWNLVEMENKFSYTLNRDHPILAAVSRDLDDSQMRALQAFLTAAEGALPIDDIQIRLSQDKIGPDEVDRTELIALAKIIYETLPNKKTDTFRMVLKSTEPFAGRRDVNDIAEAAIREMS